MAVMLRLNKSHIDSHRFIQILFLILTIFMVSPGFAGDEDAKFELPAELKRLILTEQYSQLQAKLRKLAVRGDAEGQYQLGILYLQGHGIKKNKKTALYWFEKAAVQNHVEAQFNSAMLLLPEAGRREKALTYLNAAAAGGHKMAEKHLQKIMADGDNKKGMSRATLNQQLIYSVKKGELKQVNDWLGAGADANSQDNTGRSALILAIEKKDAAIISALLKSGADAKFSDARGNTPLHYAVRAHYPSAISLLKNKSNFEQRNDRGLTALLLAVDLSDPDLVASLLLAGANASVKMVDGTTALDLASRKSSPKINSLLKQYGAESAIAENDNIEGRLHNVREQLKQSQFNGWDELMLAASLNDSEMVTLLLQQHLSGVASYHIGAAMQLAFSSGSDDAAAVFLQSESIKEVSEQELQGVLKAAIANAGLEQFVSLYQSPLLAKTLAQANKTLIWDAINEENPSVALYLIEQGAPIGYQDDSGITLLMAAAKRGQEGVASGLIKAKAAVNEQDKLGRTALWCAAQGGNQQLVNLLKSSGANLDLPDEQGRTALIMAVKNNNRELLGQLINLGASVDVTTKSGNTPLHIAAEKSSAEVVRLLLDDESKLSRRNGNSFTPLMLAVRADNQPVVKLLLEFGANPKRKSQNGLSSFDMAESSEMTRLLDSYD